MRLTQKGGTWKNSEDEVLKAAVMKYGLNNWSRVASLLVRKTARQCKSRWYEWLDPSVKKTAWSKTEDEKLLHLVKLFPTQWKTIAEGVGRTAIQCTERYYELVDLANDRVPADDDPRKLRPGEIDPNPEAKPARADPRDLDEDEKEMLAEARARLANTRGKKAKRKAREKQLEEARRVAMLQKRRELKAAGISIGGFHVARKKGDIDYQNEIPFEHKPLKGFHAVGPEETPAIRNDAANMRLQQIEEHQARERQRRLRLQDRRTLKKLHEQNLPAALKKVAEQSNPFLYRKRSELALPEPIVSDAELGALAATIKKATAQAQGLEGQRSGLLKGVAGTAHLLPTANLPKGATPATALAAMTPMVNATATGVLRQEAIMQEARNALARQEMCTPLEGGESFKEEPVGTEKLKRKRAPMTPITTTSIMTGLAVPVKHGLTPAGTTDHGLDSRKRRRMRTGAAAQLTVNSILASLPEVENDLMTTAVRQLKVELDEIDEGEDFMEDERDKELHHRRKKEQFINTLADIHSRVKIFTDFYPRPLDLPDNPDAIMEILRSARRGLDRSRNSEDTFFERLSRRTCVSLERCKLITSQIDAQIAAYLVDDNDFFPPDDHLKLFSDPVTVDKSVSIARSFLGFNAQKHKNLSFSRLRSAGQLLDEEVSMLTSSLTKGSPAVGQKTILNADEMKMEIKKEDETTSPSSLFSSISASCLDVDNCKKVLLFVDDRYVSVEIDEVRTHPELAAAFIKHVKVETENQRRLAELQQVKFRKLRNKQEKLVAGYKAIQKDAFQKLDMLFERQAKLAQSSAVYNVDLDELLSMHRKPLPKAIEGAQV
eukprot:Gregarina_sp_Poly_1__3404@NODE_1988_length_2934_cov_152_411231_g1282_i0_p1_GENE_NODE_1988_length_2934_cov_152_411231_g1282_i0NODE_1988_length_2934_cov_152_411231_g1282_i0_p1_ORF_typecomplete_len832_score136_96Myb_DNAbind_6/PF13921_6/1e17Myb_DNAbind_6/PF13921_6/3_3e11Myb_DNAbind_6/PF13921_6/1_3e04Myb_DNAbinding/PF00249_31/8_4e12Myb_DNAbinding/PF00249_31/2_5e08Myb_DNAbinding/PF00249_31/1_8e04SANT_DAMP1_like/PF16282_5/0_11PepX_N/PF09168_10/0_21_NODE_1988_length_2934_cov_152_411231_g1282_i01732668